MGIAKEVGKVTVGLGSLSLAVRSSKMVKEQMKKPKPKKLIKGFVDLTVGTALLVPVSKLTNKLE